MKKIYSVFITQLTAIYNKTFRKGQVNINGQPDNVLIINPKGMQTFLTTQDFLQTSRLFTGELVGYATNGFLTSAQLESFYQEEGFSDIEDLAIGGVAGKTRIVIKQDGSIKFKNDYGTIIEMDNNGVLNINANQVNITTSTPATINNKEIAVIGGQTNGGQTITISGQ